ncbi:hypothetical protein [Clostridium psychrophilum]|uniref:hypothetical protein n=1 Tax=Clostridium psychrophilum TaxID=132926 RepID=UPI001C0B9AEF|nr:hypothetical protein [Clostridium psychrophilum]MBU3183195.1 hypothetical protein [Clostridium psychrophilum]
MDEWSEKIKQIIIQRNKRLTEIQDIFTQILNTSKMGMRCDFKMNESNKLIWDLEIGNKTFTLTNEEILKGQNVEYYDKNGYMFISKDKKKDLEETIKELILEKISQY